MSMNAAHIETSTRLGWVLRGRAIEAKIVRDILFAFETFGVAMKLEIIESERMW